MSSTPSTMRLTVPFLPVGAALFCIQLDFFSLNLALPTIAADLGTTVTNLQWLLSGYMIALGASLIPAGRAGDILGRRLVLLTGVAVFGTTSLVCGLTSHVPVLIAARVAQGVGAALVFPTAFALVTNATDERDRPRVVGALLGVAGVGTALGPVVGGVLASSAGWRWVFLLNVPIALFALWRGRFLSESRDETGPRTLATLDWAGVGTVVAGLVLVSIAIDDVSVEGWTSAVTLVPLLAGLASLAAFVGIETRVSAPLVRPSLLGNGLFVLLTVAGTIANIGSCVYIFLATLDLQDVRGLSAAAAGLAFFLSSVGLAL
jgi:MFS family permease